MVDGQQEKGFNQLCFYRRCAHRDDRFFGENWCSLRHGPDVAGEVKMRQIIQESLGEHLPSPQISNVLRVKVQILNVLHDLLQTGGNRKPTAIRTLTEEHIKIANAVLESLFKVTVSHGQLIKVAEHGQIQFLVDSHNHTSWYFFLIISMICQNSNHNFRYPLKCAAVSRQNHAHAISLLPFLPLAFEAVRDKI